MSRQRRLRWGSTPGAARLEAELRRQSRWWISLVVGFIACLAGIAALQHCVDDHAADHGPVGPPTSNVGERVWHSDPSPY